MAYHARYSLLYYIHMAYDEQLAERVHDVLGLDPAVTEKKMFGGLAFMLNGNMCVGIVDHDLMVRVGKDDYEIYLAEPHARPMDFTGKPLKGFLYVAADGIADAHSLKKWIERGVAYAASLPAK